MQIDEVTWTSLYVSVWVFDIPMVYADPDYWVEEWIRENVSNLDASVAWDWYTHGMVIRFERGYE